VSTAAEPVPLAGAVYDRAAHRRDDVAWLQEAWTRARIVAVSPDSSTPVRIGPDGVAHLALLEPAEIPGGGPRRFLGVVGDTPYFAATVPPAEGWRSLRELGRHADDLEAGLLTAAIALEQWHARHTHCPRCGAATEESRGGWIRVCTADGSEHFPRTDPAVIMLVHDRRGRALLGRGTQWAPGRFSTLAGFVEPGESLEAAVAREVGEEVGVAVTDIRYIGSQPWPFPASLMLGFTAVLDGDARITLDGVEMADAGWFTRSEVRAAAEWTDRGSAPDDGARLRGIPPVLSISRYLIDYWLAGKA
jgi:NAD+ diphosphatase